MLPLMSVRSTGCWPPLKWHTTAFLHQLLQTRHPHGGAARRGGRPAAWASPGRQDTASHSLDVPPWRRCADGWKMVKIERLRFDGCACPPHAALAA